jgi:hypothetical protein
MASLLLISSSLQPMKSSAWCVPPSAPTSLSNNTSESRSWHLPSCLRNDHGRNPLSPNPGWSTGSPPKNAKERNILGNLLGLLGIPEGISGSHNKYDTDTFLLLGDLYRYCNDYALQVSQFQSCSTCNSIPQPQTTTRKSLPRSESSFKRLIAENPEGVLNQGLLKSFAISGGAGELHLYSWA